jgi:hypothetical protein
MTFPSFCSLRTFCFPRSFSDDTSSALLLLRTMRFRNALRSPWAGRFPASPAVPLLPFLVFSCLMPFFGAATMPFLLGAVAWRAADVENNAARERSKRGAVDEHVAASVESWEKLRRHIDGGIVAVRGLSPVQWQCGR